AYAASHFFSVVRLKSLDFYSTILGFVAFILLFLLSGWKAGLLSLPIGLITSFFGAFLARTLKRKYYDRSQNL
ncbi:MAG: hypothetical protein ACRECJ_05455, partial [Limisphaerales bacterium]